MSDVNRNAYRRIKIDLEHEEKIVEVLMNSGQSFRSVSETGYVISTKQCEDLNNLGIPYTKL